MEVLRANEPLARYLAARRAGERIAFVPTMGALHDGHGACVAKARAVTNARVVCSIFVNPTQFGPSEDADRYPRTLDADLAKLEAWGCDAVYVPSAHDIYPENSMPAIERAISLGVDVIEIDTRLTKDGVPVLASVAAIFWQITPDLPRPVTTILPRHAPISSTARTKLWSSRSIIASRPLASMRSTSAARLIMRSDFIAARTL